MGEAAILLPWICADTIIETFRVEEANHSTIM